jgi:hypothetical protein
VPTDYVGLGTESPHPYLIGDPEGGLGLTSVCLSLVAGAGCLA